MVDMTPVVDLFLSKSWALPLRGILNSTRPSSKRKTAVSIHDLLAMSLVCDRSEELVPFRVGLLFGYFGYLRVSNLAPAKVSEWDPSRNSVWSDISCSSKGVVISLKWTKTRQHAPHPAAIPMPALRSSPLCPLRAWNHYVSLLQGPCASPDNPLLLTVT